MVASRYKFVLAWRHDAVFCWLRDPIGDRTGIVVKIADYLFARSDVLRHLNGALAELPSHAGGGSRDVVAGPASGAAVVTWARIFGSARGALRRPRPWRPGAFSAGEYGACFTRRLCMCHEQNAQAVKSFVRGPCGPSSARGVGPPLVSGFRRLPDAAATVCRMHGADELAPEACPEAPERSLCALTRSTH